MAISDNMRDAIRASGKSITSLAQECGISQPMLTRFMDGQDLRLAMVDKLCSYFGLELRPAGKSKAKGPAMPAVDWATAEPKTKPNPSAGSVKKRK
jgi:hypothetical protein